MRYFLSIFLFLMVFSLSAQNNEMFKQKRERKRVWRRHHGERERSNKTAYNPYLHKKDKDKPSARMARGDKKEIRHQKRMAKKAMRRGKKKTHS